MTEGRARTVFIGSGGFGRETLWRLADHPDVELVGVVTAPPRPAGRGGRTAVTPIHEAARHLDVRRILTPARLREPAALDEVLGLAPELVVLADYGQIVPSALLDLRHRAFTRPRNRIGSCRTGHRLQQSRDIRRQALGREPARYLAHPAQDRLALAAQRRSRGSAAMAQFRVDSPDRRLEEHQLLALAGVVVARRAVA